MANDTNRDFLMTWIPYRGIVLSCMRCKWMSPTPDATCERHGTAFPQYLKDLNKIAATHQHCE